jgi:membrane glycosyltransferase
MRTFAPGVDAHWPAYQAVKTRFGFMSLLGHGAMVSIEAYNATGGFPSIVAEDIGFAIKAKEAGYKTTFALDVTCEEEFPPDYAAFKKRHKKWTEGNMEFIKTFSPTIFFSRKLSWFEKLDIILFTFSLPLTGVFSLYVLINAVIFPFMGFRYHYPLWMLLPTVLFLVAPMINDMLTWAKGRKFSLLSYLGHSVLLFGSVYFASLFASTKTIFGASVFHVTPKTSSGVGLRQAIRQNMSEIIAGFVLTLSVLIASGSVLPIVLIIIPVIFATYLSVMNTGDHSMSQYNGTHILQKEKQNLCIVTRI